MRGLIIVGARPNFIKAAPIIAEMRKHADLILPLLIHTGQHYDDNMSGAFLRELGLPEPDVHLGVGPGTHGEQTARVMLALEPIIVEKKPDWVMVVGDVNSTAAAALVCAKLGVPIAHVEAGLRSFDRTMSEEINRLVTDQLSDLLFTTEESGNENLRREGIPQEKIHFVGNVMIDSLVGFLTRAESSTVLRDLGIEPQRYGVVTVHRPSNVDDPETLGEILSALASLAREMPVIFPVHPRTRKRIGEAGWNAEAASLRLTEPLGYLDFLKLYSSSRLVLTDSGGVQEETTYLGIPCLTLRPNTERPVTIRLGTNRLVASRREPILRAVAALLAEGTVARRPPPPLWDGKAAARIVAVMTGI